jgi:hypothetical protein
VKSTDISSFSNTNKKARKFSTVVAAEKSLNYESGTDKGSTKKFNKKNKGSSIFMSDETGGSLSPKFNKT